MGNVRWRKVVRDLWLHKSRTILVALAISIGIIGAGAVLDTWALLRNATRQEFSASNPASATLRVDAIDDATVERVRAMPDIAFAEMRAAVGASVYTSTGWRNALLMSAPELDRVRIGVIKQEEGEWPPQNGGITIESSSVDFAGVVVGDKIQIRVGEKEATELPITGIARDVGLAPGWMEHVIYLFAAPQTLAQLGATTGLDQLRIVVRDRSLSREQILRIAEEAKVVIERNGHRVTDIDVPVPGRHVHAAQIDSLLYTQGAFGALALLLSGFLVVNLISAMLAGQVREIGVMKAIGARSGQIAAMYIGLALVLGIVACAIASPAGLIIGRGYAQFTADLLNFDITGARVPNNIILIQLAVGMLLPIVAASFPVYRGCRISVSEALRDFGIGGRGDGSNVILRRASGFARPVLLSLRNAFRRRSRMALTLLTLAMGGAVYLGAINLRASVIQSVDTMFGTQRFDMALRFATPHHVDSIEAIVRGIDGVANAEAWSGARAAVKRADGTTGNSFVITAPPATSKLLSVPIETGRWISSNNARELVVNRRLTADEPTLNLGDSVKLVIRGKETWWRIVGVTEASPSPTAYADRDVIAAAGAAGTAGTVVIAGQQRSPASQFDLIQRLRQTLGDSGLDVQSSQLMSEQRAVIEDHLLMVAGFLGIMAKLIIVVGGLGLASTMSLGVLERTREIGVMRAIGAGHRSILGMVQIEGLVIALLSWLAAIPLSIPMSVVLAKAFGRIMLPVPVNIQPDVIAMVQWLAVVVIVSVLACLWPAVRAIRIPTARALAYE
jgi:putative ABC transport system permease protein